MSLYIKFLKDVLIKKGKHINNKTIEVGGNCSAVIQKLPPKFKDPGSITIPCSIRSVSVGKALIDLGASINLMLLSMWRKIGNLKIDPTRMTLQLVDRSITRPFRVVEDVLVKVNQLTFLVDFVIMNIEDVEIPMILGRPFMLTAKCVVEWGKETWRWVWRTKKSPLTCLRQMSIPVIARLVLRWRKMSKMLTLLGGTWILCF